MNTWRQFLPLSFCERRYEINESKGRAPLSRAHQSLVQHLDDLHKVVAVVKKLSSSPRTSSAHLQQQWGPASVSAPSSSSQPPLWCLASSSEHYSAVLVEFRLTR